MYILKETFSSTASLPQGFVFDIETTGLSPKYHQIAMISYAYEEDGHWVMEQHMVEDPRDELLLLLHFFEKSKHFLYCIHYNGDSFDLPFINKRLAHHDMDFSYPKSRGFDLYVHFKRKGIKGSLKLKDQEKRVGFHRTDMLSGKQWVDLFFLYQEERKQRQKEALLLHNKEDVLATLALVEYSPRFQKQIQDRLYQDHLLLEAYPGTDEIRLVFFNQELTSIDLPGISHGPLLFAQRDDLNSLSGKEKKEALLAYDERVFFENIKKELIRLQLNLF